MGSINSMLKVKDNFEAMIDEKLSSLEIWVKKIEKSNKPYYIPPDLLSSIRKYVQEAYIYDFDLIVSFITFIYGIEQGWLPILPVDLSKNADGAD